MNEPSKNVDINGATYQIGRLGARTGSWVLMQVLTKVLPFGSMLSGNGKSSISESEFLSLQAHCLSVCRRMENGAPMPIFLMPDRFAIKELEYDLVTVTALTMQSLSFNLSPFFAENGLSHLMEALPGLTPSPLKT